MKSWIIPNVKIESFVASEYVSACVDPGPVVNHGYFYVDFDGDGTYNNFAESFPVQSNGSYINNGHAGEVAPGWHNNVHLIPTKDKMGQNIDSEYSDRYKFLPPTTETYDIYIFAAGTNHHKFVMYPHAEGGHSGTPNQPGSGKYFS